MKVPRLAVLLGIVFAVVLVGGVPRWAASQTAPELTDRFQFEVVESFDARYEGDTPGHMGRHGGLGDAHPQVALGDPVYRDEQQVGVVSGLKWSRAQGSLEVEFDPSSKKRIAVGDVVWLKLGVSRPVQ